MNCTCKRPMVIIAANNIVWIARCLPCRHLIVRQMKQRAQFIVPLTEAGL